MDSQNPNRSTQFEMEGLTGLEQSTPLPEPEGQVTAGPQAASSWSSSLLTSSHGRYGKGSLFSRPSTSLIRTSSTAIDFWVRGLEALSSSS